jgi:hypothetical protein
MKVQYRTTIGTITAIRNSKGIEYRLSQRVQYNETGETVTICEILQPTTICEILQPTTIYGGEYRIKLKDSNGLVFASFDIEYAPLFLTIK